MKDSPENVRIWTAIFDNERMVDGDDDRARNVADSTISARENRVKWSIESLKKERKQKRRRFISENWPWAFVPVLIAVFTWLVFFLAGLNNNDWAGYGSDKAPVHSVEAIKAYYGENDMPKKIELVDQKKGDYLGRHAWQSTYRIDKSQICVYVWLSDTVNFHQVTSGACQ